MTFYYSTMDANQNNTLRVPQAKLTDAADGAQDEDDIEEQQDDGSNVSTPSPKKKYRGTVAGHIRSLEKFVDSNANNFTTVLAGSKADLLYLCKWIEKEPANARLGIADSKNAISCLFGVYPTVQLLTDARNRDNEVGRELRALHVLTTKLLVAVVSSNNSRNNEILALALVNNCPKHTFDHMVAGFEALVVGRDGIFTTADMFFLRAAYYIPAEDTKLEKVLEIVETLIGKKDFDEQLIFSSRDRDGGNGDEFLSILKNKYYMRSNYRSGNDAETSIAYGKALKKVRKIISVLNEI